MKKRTQQILAIIAIILLLGLSILTTIFAITGNPNFLGMLALTIFVPVIIWGYMIFYKYVKSNE